MQLLDLTLPTPAENLALDEALLLEAEAAGRPTETLRLWEAQSPLVAIGRSTPRTEVNEAACRARGIPILRRTSGGAAIVAGPGCLMYAVVLSYARRPALQSIDEAHAYVLETIATALGERVPRIARQGISDLTVDGRKVSGNSLRSKREHVLYHGTLLYDFPLELIAECLYMPGRQPDYRAGRGHAEFVANLPLGASTLRAALIDAFEAKEAASDWPRDRVRQLVDEKYGRDEWHR